MAELDELRVRLEGAVELVERATAEMVAATKDVRAGRTSGLLAAMTESESAATQQAFETVQRVASKEPVLAPVRERFIVAREALRAATLARGAEFGLRSMPVESVAAALVQYPVLYRSRAVDPRAAGGLLLAAFGIVAAANTHPLLLFFPGAVLLAVAAFVWFAPRLVVTAGYVRLGGTLVAVRDIESVLIGGDLGPLRSIVRFRLRGGGIIEVDVPPLRRGFVTALERVTTVEQM